MKSRPVSEPLAVGLVKSITDTGTVKSTTELVGWLTAQEEIGEGQAEEYAKRCAAGWFAYKGGGKVKEADSPEVVLKGTDWKTVDVPDELCAQVVKMPGFYVPTNVKVWHDLFERLATKRGKLTAPEVKDVDTSMQAPDQIITSVREALVGEVEDKMASATGAELTGGEVALYQQILRAKLTMNIPLDNLFKFRAPHLLNGFEVKDKFGKGSANTEGELGDERVDAEKRHFGLGTATPSRVRPRYAALNFKGHPTGAAARNDRTCRMS